MYTLLSLVLSLLLAACSSGGGSSQAAPAEKPKTRKLPAPQHLPASARALLSDRMQHHGQAMSDIVWSVLFLDYEAAADIAEEIAREPKLARPVQREASELNSLLPEQFFGYQDELAMRAQMLATAARAEDPEAVSQALGELSGTCVRCHSAYMRDPVAR